MDIKSRNISYSYWVKFTAVILIWLCFVVFMGSAMVLIFNSQIAGSSSYFDTPDFKHRFGTLIHNVVEANVELISPENIKATEKNEETIEKKLTRLNVIKSKLSGTENFVYYLRNTVTGESISNIYDTDPVQLIEKQPAKAYIGKDRSKYDLPSYGEYIEEMLVGTDYEIYAAVTVPMKEGDAFYSGLMDYTRAKAVYSYAKYGIIPSFILLVIASAYLACVTGRKEKAGKVVLQPIDGLYADVHTLLVLIAAFLSLTVMINVTSPNNIISWLFPLIVLSLDAFIGISYLTSMIRQAKAGRLLSNMLALMLYRKLKAFARLCFEGKLFKPSVLLVLLGYGLINGILFDLGVDISAGAQESVFTVLLLAFNLAAVYYAAKSLLSLSQIIEAAKEISSGNLEYVLKSSEMPAAFSGLAENIKDIQGGMKKAVAEAVRGERMKTELITNVSHDLKTPLTSIVNYVGLLKKEDLNNQRAEEYVSILEEKSFRLKQLIEDLVEASKASSGNLAVNAEKVDLHELVMQACGEYEERINKAELDLRINADEKNVFILADGKHMWRIIENLLSNAVKYSMPRSRVYINISQNSDYGILTIKNMSAFPLNIPPEQLTERFVRGDEARTTEGSGLGLSIAQSLAALQGGSFSINIDGDLFKVSVGIPLWEEK